MKVCPFTNKRGLVRRALYSFGGLKDGFEPPNSNIIRRDIGLSCISCDRINSLGLISRSVARRCIQL